MVDGGRPLATLDRILERYRVVQHGVSMYFGSAERLNRDPLEAPEGSGQAHQTPCGHRSSLLGSVDRQIQRMTCCPCPNTFEAAKLTARNVREARDYLEVPIAVENVSSYCGVSTCQK